MDFLDLAKSRYSSRDYRAQMVEDEKLTYILEAGRIAPSANNTQPWIFIIVKEKKGLEKIRLCYHREWFKSAPCYIIACGRHDESWKRSSDGKDHCDIDVAIATDHMTLAASQQGLATCWICNFNRELLSKHLNLPEIIEPIVILSIGYPNDKADMERHRFTRKKLDYIVYEEKYIK
ncbi:MAG: nitroreductase family protein [Bacteroidales bacterium]|nr:nitroreductase family protein [Bacteroidales bacterium]MBN2756307.1 nitroreductase family protein [Bacteroidales bacterium]